jgi:hypothetical protein
MHRRVGIAGTILCFIAALALAGTGPGCGGSSSGQEDAGPVKHDAGSDAAVEPGRDATRPQIDGQADVVVDPCAAVDCAACAVYVDLAAAAGGDGTSPATAFQKVQPGIDAAAAAAGQCCTCEVRVATGTYYVYASAARDTIRLHERVDVLGGYPTGFNGTRDPVANPTVLDGRKAAASGGGPDDAFHVYHVVTGADRLRFDGFTVQGGDAAEDTNDFNPNNYGGGMYNVDVSPTVGHCVFTANHAVHGAGVFNAGGTVRIESARFEGNTAAEQGGGLDNRFGVVEVVDSRFTGNAATDGAGLHSGGGATVTLSGDGAGSCLLDGNTATGGGGGLANEASSLTITGCTVSHNTADRGGGLLSRDDADSALVGDGCLFEANVARRQGGALAGYGSSHVVTGCTLRANSIGDPDPLNYETRSGAAIHVEDARLRLDGAVVVGNLFTDPCGCYSEGCGCTHKGGAVSALRSALDVVASRFESNQALDGKAAYLEESTTTITGTSILTNSPQAGCTQPTCFGAAVSSWKGTLVLTESDLTGNVGEALAVTETGLAVSRCRFVGNLGSPLSVRGGGQVPIESSLFVGNGSVAASEWAVISMWGVDLRLTNCTIVANLAYENVVSTSCEFGSVGQGVTVTNTIVWGNTCAGPAISPAGGSCYSPAVTNSDIQGGYAGTGNLNVDPGFVSTAGADPTLWDLHLKKTPLSPCIDTGTSTGVTATQDLDGNPRTYGTTVDMGAYENQGN